MVAACIFGLLSGNFLYQAVFASTPDYSLAFERSFFEAMAIIAFATIQKWVAP